MGRGPRWSQRPSQMSGSCEARCELNDGFPAVTAPFKGHVVGTVFIGFELQVNVRAIMILDSGIKLLSRFPYQKCQLSKQYPTM